ncbi:MAG: hypothetical protein ACLP00_11185 [Terracidiphilus sp.]
MKYNIYLVNVINSKDYKYLCRIQRRNDARSVDIAADSRFKNEDEMYLMLKGVLLPARIGLAIRALRSCELEQVEYRNIEISDERAIGLGWPKKSTKNCPLVKTKWQS